MIQMKKLELGVNSLSLRQKQQRRRQELKKIFTLSVFSVLLVLTISLGGFRIWSQAHAKQDNRAYKYYTNIEIQYGDTLWDIASRYYDASFYTDYDAYIQEVMLTNRMQEPRITAGSYLVIPYYSEEFLE